MLEGLLEHERATGGSAEATAARLRGQEYLLERRMFRRLSTREIVDPAFTLFSFPTYHFYDVEDGRWPLQNPHPGQLHFAIHEGEAKPSRWNTLRAMRVLRWYEQARK